MITAQKNIKDWLKEAVGVQELNEKDLTKSGIVFEAVISADKIQEVAKEYLAQNFFLESLTAVDFQECFEVVYHFNQWHKCARSCVKILVDKNENKAPSISSVYKSANWFEREVYDLFGIIFTGHPNLKRLLLPESAEIFPLLKSFKGEPAGADVAQSLKLIKEDSEGFEVSYPQSVTQHHKDYYLNFGPQHPSTHGVLRVLLHLSGEKVLDGEPIIGYSHRHHEKMMEIQSYLACWPNMGRLDYVGAMSYNFCYALLMEKAMGIQPSLRVEYIRVLTTELNRISSHLLWMGTFLLDLGAFTPFFYGFDDREQILDILEMVTGERLTYDYFRFGGLDKDIPEEMIPAVKKFIPSFKKRLKDYDVLITRNIIFKKRAQHLGILTKESALAYGVTGPSLRASGVAMDLRRQEPYSIYPELDFDVATATEGDVYARYLVRMKEIKESLKIIEQILDKIPAGPVSLGKLPKNAPKGEYYTAVEAARGSFGMYLVSDGSLNPYRIKLRTPSFSNLNAIVDMLPGCLVSDVVAVLGSIDIVLPEIDR
jgi:NADH-quinone oxidoreductase subunit D